MSVKLQKLVWAAAVLLSGCASPEDYAKQQAEIVACEESGGTPYVSSSGVMGKCASPREQSRLEQLELACVRAGGEPDYQWRFKYYLNCEQKPEVIINNNNGPKAGATCPPGSAGKVYGC